MRYTKISIVWAAWVPPDQQSWMIVLPGNSGNMAPWNINNKIAVDISNGKRIRPLTVVNGLHTRKESRIDWHIFLPETHPFYNYPILSELLYTIGRREYRAPREALLTYINMPRPSIS